MTHTEKTTWHDFPAITLESPLLRVVMVPDLGAKIVSLFDKAHSREWLVPPMRPLKAAAYAADFVSQDMSGWDEMMPTIVADEVGGARLPDHGEVWSIPWMVEKDGDEVVLAVHGRAMPYRFSRSAALVTPDCLELRYGLKNRGQTALPFLWAAHPQFAADAHTRIILPPEVNQLVNVIADDPAWGAVGERYPWPHAQGLDGQHWSLERVRPVENHTCRKFYIPPEQHIAWAALIDDELECQLRLNWSPLEVPYLGLWVDEGMYNTAPVAALEPSTGYYDSLGRAVQNGKVVWIDPGQEKNWTLQVRVSGRS